MGHNLGRRASRRLDVRLHRMVLDEETVLVSGVPPVNWNS
jgi:hypothetical protein